MELRIKNFPVGRVAILDLLYKVLEKSPSEVTNLISCT